MKRYSWYLPAVLPFVKEVAALHKDGEDFDGEEFEMSNDAAWETLHSLISRARELVAAQRPANGD